MNYFENILNKEELNRLINHFLDHPPCLSQYTRDFSQEIENSYQQIFEKLEKMYPSATRNDNSLFDVIADFSAVHKEVFFQMGLILGFYLSRDLEKGYEELKNSGIF